MKYASLGLPASLHSTRKTASKRTRKTAIVHFQKRVIVNCSTRSRASAPRISYKPKKLTSVSPRRPQKQDAAPVCRLLHGLSESRSDRTWGGGVGGPEGLWSGPGIRRSERSRGVAERSLAGGAGREGGSRLPSVSRKEHPESAGTDQRDGPSEGALQEDRAGSRSRGPAARGYFPPSPPGSAAGNHPGPGCYR